MPILLEKLLAAGAVVVSAGILAIYAGLIALMWPASIGGANAVQFAVLVFAAGVPISLIIAAHLVLARQLYRDAIRRGY